MSNDEKNTWTNRTFGTRICRRKNGSDGSKRRSNPASWSSKDNLRWVEGPTRDDDGLR